MSFVVSEGAIRGLSRPDLPRTPRLIIADGLSIDYFELWRTQPAVRTCVSFLARNISQLGIQVFNRVGDNDRRRLIDHPVAQLFEMPNPWTTRYRLMDALVHDMAIFDRAYWWKTKTANGNGLVRLPPPLVTPKGDNWLTPDRFEIAAAKGRRMIPADQVVYFRGYSGTDDFGTSPIEALRQTLAEEFAATRMREQVLRNGARISGYLQRPAEAPKWSQDAREKFRKSWQSQYTGNGPEVGGTPILEDGMTFNGAAQNAKELQYLEVRKLSREEVAAAYYIPPPMIGILDHATFSNITEQHKMLYQDTLGPWLAMFAEEFALQLIPDLTTGSDRVYVEFNLREKLTGAFEQRAASIQTAVGGPWMTINEARALDNRPPVDGGDELIRPLNVTQNGDSDPVPADPGTDEGQDVKPAADEPADDDQEDA
ncbi:HK97 family phage portal protein [Nocardia transvalensis]|uniref:HK97 family phage portal protein n=1 Tax=Nocardia transvalensis TaxID=37333 RepID=A0A7W9UJB9_9NOCA|nr:phage portal protein [Nocardia transvalensis]MBB5915288.1 HK97 family phage portal protein [Nocardia transvalensis]